MNDITSLFFELIRVAIGNQACLSHSPSADEWGELYAMAKKQSLVGICFAGVQRLQGQQQCPPERLYLQWMGMAAKIQQRNEVMNRLCAELQAKLSDSGMRSAILKGQGMAALYAIKDEGLKINDLSGLRQSGDIDVYVDCGREKAIEYARNIQDEVDWDYKHLHLKMFKDTEVEMHYVVDVMLNPWRNYKLQKYWESKENEVFGGRVTLINGTEITTPTLEFNCVYILLHIYRHMFGEGVGLRQLMDYYFVLKAAFADNPDWEQKANLREVVKHDIEQLGLKRFAESVLWILGHIFGLTMIHMPWTPNEKGGRVLMEEILLSGNFSKGDISISYANHWHILVSTMKRDMRLLFDYPCEVVSVPFYYLWHFCWKRVYKYTSNRNKIT